MQDIFSVEGKHILITGASSGLGAHMATMLAGRHAHPQRTHPPKSGTA